MTREEIKNKIEGKITPERFIHSLGVMNIAVELARKHGEDREKAAIAGLLHDCARDIKGREIFDRCRKYNIEIDAISLKQPELLHGPVGSVIAGEEYGVKDEEVLNAIRYHTTGREGMSLMEKIIFIADYIEPNRDFPGVGEVRKLAFNSINMALIQSLDKTIKHVIAKRALIHPDTIHARNYLIFEYRLN